MDRIVIIGASQAGACAAFELRRVGFAGTITVIGDEPHMPYQRPPLSKELLYGSGTAPNLYLFPEQSYTDQKIELVLGQRAISIDRGAQRVTTDIGTSYAYDHLLIATGTRPRRLPIAGLEEAITLRTLDDASRLSHAISACNSAAIIGGGFIGLEVAVFLSAQGKSATVVEASSQLMGRVVSARTSTYFYDFHSSNSVRIELSEAVVGGSRHSNGWQVELASGRTLEADLLISAIGAVANLELARDAGLSVDRGIIVDDTMLTSDSSISAIGDCAEHTDPIYGSRVSLESVQNAVDQGKTFAARIVGNPAPYTSLPWFWSTQGPAKLQIAGLAMGQTHNIVRQDPTRDDRLAVFRYCGDRLAAVETINQPGDHLLARRLLANGVAVPKEAVADPAFNLRELL